MKRIISLAAILVIASTGTGCQTLTGKTIGQQIDDKFIKHEIKGRLAARDIRNLTSVHVDANRGAVYLTGNVAKPEYKALAERIAWDVDGVREVVNHLEVPATSTAQRPPAAAQASAPPTVTSPAASPTTTGVLQNTVTGQVSSVDRSTGRLTLRNGGSDLVLQFPPSALQNVKQGDRVTVQLALSPAR